MSKTWMKKMIAIAMTTTMLCTMVGCEKKESKEKETEKQDTKEMVFQATDFEIEGVEGEISDVYVLNDKLYMRTYEWTDDDSLEETTEDESAEDSAKEAVEETVEDSAEEEEEESVEDGAEEEEEESVESSVEEEEEESAEDGTEEDTAEEVGEEIQEDSDEEETEETMEDSIEEEITATERLYSMNVDGTDVKEIKLPKLDEQYWRDYMSVCNDGTFLFLLSKYDRKTEKPYWAISKVDAQGTELVREDVTDLLGLSEDSYISKFVVDANNHIILVTDQTLFIVADDLKSVDKINTEFNIESAAVTKDGQIVCGYTAWEEDNSSVKIQILDVENKKLGKAVTIDMPYLSSSDSMMDGNDYDFYYKDESGVYGFDMAANKSLKVMDYVASNIVSEDAWSIKPITKDTFIGTTYDMNESAKMVKYSKVDPSTIKDKKVITCGTLWMDELVKKQAIEFNKNNQEYEIQLKDYSNEEDPMAKMNADIIAGNIPDIMMLNELPYEQYIAKGILEDLTPYFEKDEELNTEDIIDSVYEAMQIDGKLYYIAPSFGVTTLVAKTSEVGTETGWTFDEMKALLKEKEDSARPFHSENKSEMLYSLLGIGVGDFVDQTTGECSFNTQDFKDILEICNTGTNEETEYNEDTPSMVSLIQEDKILFYDGWVSLDEVQILKKMFGEDISYIGYPNKEKQGSYFYLDSQIGISAKSEVKEEAWKFVRTFMTKEFQATNMYMYNTPVRKDCFDMLIKEKTATEKYTDEFGREIEPLNTTVGWDELEIELKPLSQEEAKMYIDLVNNTKKIANNNQEIFNIIEEEAKAYFAGDKSLDETVEIIQKRAQTYVNENR